MEIIKAISTHIIEVITIIGGFYLAAKTIDGWFKAKRPINYSPIQFEMEAIRKELKDLKSDLEEKKRVLSDLKATMERYESKHDTLANMLIQKFL